MIRRYMMREIAAPLVAWTAFLCGLFFVVAFMRGTDVLLGSAVTLTDLARFTASLLPQLLMQGLPIAFLLSLLLGLGRLAEDGELAAMQALGMPPRSFLWAPLALGAGVSLVMALLASTLQPWGVVSVKQLATEIIRRNVMEDVKGGVFHEDVPDFAMYTEQASRGGQWRHVLLFDGRDHSAPLLVVAKAGRVRPTAQEDQLVIELEQGSVHRAARSTDEYTTVAFGQAAFSVGIGESISRGNRFQSKSEEQTPAEMVRAVGEAARAGQPTRALEVALWWRVGLLLMPLAFAVLGAPLALVRRGGGRARGLVLTLVGFAGWYVLSRAGVQLGERGLLPAVLAGQLANVVFVAVGLAMMRALDRQGLA